MAYLAPTPKLGLVLPDPASVQAFETTNVNSNFTLIDTGVGQDRTRLTALEALPASSTIVSTGNWTVAGAFGSVNKKWATIAITCTRTTGTIAAGATENIASLGSDLIPLATVSCPAVIFGISGPIACFAQISTGGFISIISPAGAGIQNNAAVNVTYRVA